MYGYAASKFSLSHEEKLSLIEEKSLSDVESESGRADIETRFSTRRWITSAKSYCKAVRFSSWSSTILRTAIFLTPSFVHHRLTRERSRNDRIGPTAYLDGMRGLAALFVFFCHYFYTAFAIAEGWGHNNANYEIWKLPFVRLLVSGPTMVCLFFVISGYALSLKPLKQIRSRTFDGFAATMSSFVFRRGFRLFLPTTISTFMVLILLQLGFYEHNQEFANDKQFFRNVVEFHPQRKETLNDELSRWGTEMFNFVHVWGWEKFGGSTGYDVHLWTIPVEYRCSMMLFLVLFGLARLRTGLRFLCLAGISWFVLRNDRWEMFLFLAGMGLAELDIIRGAHNPPPSQTSARSILPFEETPSTRKRCPKALMWIVLSIPALYLMCEPDLGTEGMPGWQFLGTLIPEWFSDKYRYWQMIGSVIFVFCVARSPQWQSVFNTSFVQYFGRISYAIYLMHGPVMHTIGYIIEKWAWSLTGTEGYAYNTGFILASFINIPLVIWAADVFWRGVDAPTVRFTKWLESKVVILD
ncbi:acyltransferase [Pseudomassariella vexata]|uniref:Acyltransferase n=1 Tax=Pseudomassariella vexata TaxID=1141098 RepID=A0A1Y2EB37_9PEZI|nr:acyltransferase [Pseudomassariella vexata]ORY68778.1 acyltransferase [Pseudomassariella vexata]